VVIILGLFVDRMINNLGGSGSWNPCMSDPAAPDNQPTARLQQGRSGGEGAPTAPLPARGPGEGPGDWIGPYRLLEAIGEGGFGVVYLAERREPMVQRVALKVMKPGMDSRAVIARFEQERQALAVMDHPNVARVFDGGLTPGGRPYFVMEYVKGEPVTVFADRHRLTIRERLELFIPVCEAVQHAHMKGIIHRDLKPSNILAAPVAGAGGDDRGSARAAVVKVIDFGVAKAISHALTDGTIFTEHGQFIGTPEYISPEQAEMGATDIDTRTDVYSLGMVLYELLSGTLPFEARTLRAAGYGEIQRIIRDVDPPRPSTRLSAADERTGAAIARARQADRERIAAELRRELEWIPMKALRKDRTRRYASAESLAADVRRYLDGKPLEAAPESRAYLLRKFVRRNRVQVTAAAAVALSLVGGFGTALWQAREAAGQRDAAVLAGRREAAQREEAERQRARADERAVAAEAAENAERERADELKRVSDFLSEMLRQIDTRTAGEGLMRDLRERFLAALEKANVPEAERTARGDALGRDLVRVNATDIAAAMIDRTILTPAIRSIDERFRNDPKTDASLRQALADLYTTIGLYSSARPLQESALATRRRVLGEEHPDTLTSINDMGFLLRNQGRLAEAEAYYREALEKRRRVLGEEHQETLASINNLGALLQTQNRLAEAEAFFREAREKSRRILGEEHPQTLLSINNIGVLLWAHGRLEEAEACFREAMEKRRRVLGEEHPHTLGSINNMGFLLQAQGRLGEAEPYYREALEKRRRVLGEEHPETLASINNMGFLLQAQGRMGEAEPYLREALEKFRRLLGEEHPDTLGSINNMGYLLQAEGRLEAAEPYLREALEKRRRVLGEEHPHTLGSINNMGALLQAQGRLGEAEPYLREALEKRRRVLGEEHPDTLGSVRLMARLELAQGRAREALDLIAPFEAAARRKFTGGQAPRLADFLTCLGRARVGVGYGAERFALAEANLLEAHPIHVAAAGRGPAHPGTLECVQGLVDLYSAWDKAEPGKGYDAKAAEWRAALDAAKAPRADVPAAEKR
jgi:serine/threonine protein kinase/Tfp pilus assembly protein PilF